MLWRSVGCERLEEAGKLWQMIRQVYTATAIFILKFQAPEFAPEAKAVDVVPGKPRFTRVANSCGINLDGSAGKEDQLVAAESSEQEAKASAQAKAHLIGHGLCGRGQQNASEEEEKAEKCHCTTAICPGVSAWDLVAG